VEHRRGTRRIGVPRGIPGGLYTGPLMSVEPSPNGGVKHAPVPIARPVRAMERPRKLVLALPLPRGPVAVAAGGVTASAVLVTVARALRRRRRARLTRRSRRELRRTVVGTRSFLVDVHLLGR
jgi:hypothetical protein